MIRIILPALLVMQSLGIPCGRKVCLIGDERVSTAIPGRERARDYLSGDLDVFDPRGAANSSILRSIAGVGTNLFTNCESEIWREGIYGSPAGLMSASVENDTKVLNMVYSGDYQLSIGKENFPGAGWTMSPTVGGVVFPNCHQTFLTVTYTIPNEKYGYVCNQGASNCKINGVVKGGLATNCWFVESGDLISENSGILVVCDSLRMTPRLSKKEVRTTYSGSTGTIFNGNNILTDESKKIRGDWESESVGFPFNGDRDVRKSLSEIAESIREQCRRGNEYVLKTKSELESKWKDDEDKDVMKRLNESSQSIKMLDLDISTGIKGVRDEIKKTRDSLVSELIILEKRMMKLEKSNTSSLNLFEDDDGDETTTISPATMTTNGTSISEETIMMIAIGASIGAVVLLSMLGAAMSFYINRSRNMSGPS